jgi:hypothetical protein
VIAAGEVTQKISAEKSEKPHTKAAIFPQLSVKYFSISLAFILLVSVVLDRLIIPALEDEGKIVSASWTEEDDFIYYWAHARNKADLNQNPVWHSSLWPVAEKSAKAHRILVIGDSFVWGHGYNNMNDIWWRQLARELERRGYKDVEIIAAGMQGLNTRLELDAAKKVIPKFKPDLVIWGYIPNDADEMSRMQTADFDQKLLFRPHRQNGLLEAFKGLYPHLSHQLIALREAYLRKTRSGEFTKDNPPNWEFSLLSGENWSMYGKTLDNTANYLHSLSIPSFIMLLPYECPGKVDFDGIKAHYDRVFPPIKKAFEDRDVRVVDSYDTWINAARKEDSLVKKGVLSFGVNPANAHPNRWATYAYGVHAADVLEKDFAPILGTKSSEPTSKDAQLRVNDCIPPNLQIQQTDNKIVVVYPMKLADDFRNMPLRKPFIELNLETPINAKEITLGGTGLKGASLYITNVDAAKHFDNGEMFSLGNKNGSWLSWKLPEAKGRGINTINISAKVIGANRGLILEVK